MAEDIESIRQRLATSRHEAGEALEGLVTEVHPQAMKQRATQEAKDFVADSIDDAKKLVVDESGPRWDNIGTALFAVAGVALVAGVARGLLRAIF